MVALLVPPPPPIVNKCGEHQQRSEWRAVELCSEMGTATTATAANFPPRSRAPRLIVPLHCRFEPCCVKSLKFVQGCVNPRPRGGITQPTLSLLSRALLFGDKAAPLTLALRALPSRYSVKMRKRCRFILPPPLSLSLSAKKTK